MGCNYCGPPAPPHELDVTPIAYPSVKMSSCQNSCRDNDDYVPLDITASDSKMAILEKPGDCYSPDKCADNKTEHHTNTPDCCRCKVNPCCDATCLDRLAMRECEMSAMAIPGLNGQPKSECPLFEDGIQKS
jgi:Cu2+-exporting ATPase